MQNLDLPLFSTNSSTTEIISPVQQTPPIIFEPLENALKGIFLQNTEEHAVIKMRRILGDKAENLSDEQIQCTVTEFNF